MKPTESFDQFYQSELLPELELLEPSRKTAVNVFWMAIAILSTAIPCLLIAMTIGNPFAFLLLAPSVIFSLLKFNEHGKLKAAYRHSFKEKVIGAMVKQMDGQLSYSPESCIDLNEYRAAAIFRDRIDRYTGDDLVTGKLGSTSVRFSELHHEERQVTVDSKGNRHESWVTIFKGIFFIADFNKNFNGTTFIMPDAGDSFFGIGRLFEKLTFGRGELVKLENPAFEKLFTVYSNDQVEARYLLSTSMMEKLIAFKTKAATRLHLSFVHSNVCIAVSNGKSMFEPNVFSSGIKTDYLREYFNYLELITGIVDDLKLNLRIWGKQ